MLDVLNLDSLEPLAQARLDPVLFDYMEGGASDEWRLAGDRRTALLEAAKVIAQSRRSPFGYRR